MKYLPHLFIDNNTNSMFGYIENTTSFSMINFVRHTLKDKRNILQLSQIRWDLLELCRRYYDEEDMRDKRLFTFNCFIIVAQNVSCVCKDVVECSRHSAIDFFRNKLNSNNKRIGVKQLKWSGSIIRDLLLKRNTGDECSNVCLVDRASKTNKECILESKQRP